MTQATLIAVKWRCSSRPAGKLSVDRSHRRSRLISRPVNEHLKYSIYDRMEWILEVYHTIRSTYSWMTSWSSLALFFSGLISVGSSTPLRETAGALDAFNLPLVSVVSPHSDGDDADDIAQGRKKDCHLHHYTSRSRATCSAPPPSLMTFRLRSELSLHYLSNESSVPKMLCESGARPGGRGGDL